MSDLEKTLQDLPKLLREREEALAEREREIQRLQTSLKREHPCLGKPSDVIRLNVGGKRIDVLRRTLTQIEGSLLESMFSGRWDESLEKDKDGNFFVDQPDELFIPLINYLRKRQNETPVTRRTSPPHKSSDFLTMCEYYGLTLSVFPIGVYTLDIHKYGEGKWCWNLVKECDNGETEINSKGEGASMYWLKAITDCHSRNVVAYEVTLGQCTSAKIGWFKENRSDRFGNAGHAQALREGGLGCAARTVALDCARCGTISEGDFTLLGSAAVSLKPGTRIRSENKFKDEQVVWYIDGNAVGSDIMSDYRGGMPCLYIKGTFKVDMIELEF